MTHKGYNMTAGTPNEVTKSDLKDSLNTPSSPAGIAPLHTLSRMVISPAGN